MNDFQKMMQSETSRRAFLTRMGAAGLGASAMALLAGCGSGSGTSPAPGNVILPGATPSPSPTPATRFFDPANFPGIVGRNYTEVVLNYALTLEILEADLYRQALNIASGRPVGQDLDNNPPSGQFSPGNYSLAVGSGGIASQFVQAGFLYLAQYAYVEAAHRDFLRTVLGSISGAPIMDVTAINFTSALGTNLESILNLIYGVEETGVRAYLGAAGFLPANSASDLQTITTAVAIHSTEARHSAAVAYVLGKDTGPIYSIPGVTTGKRVTDKAAAPVGAPYSENTFQYYSDPPVVIAAVTPFIAANNSVNNNTNASGSGLVSGGI